MYGNDDWLFEDEADDHIVPLASQRIIDIEKDLTDKQLEAVRHRGSPLVILAGAGTGKTKCLTSRIGHLIASGDAQPEDILAITFTNKAARELEKKLKKELDDDLAGITVGTFHAICAKMLRDHYDKFGVKQDYVIMDSDDQKRMVRRIAKTLYGKDVDKELVKASLEFIENVRGNPNEAKHIIENADRAIYNIYAHYEKTKNEDGVLDFTDLIGIVVEMFSVDLVDPRIFAEKWKHVLVDEYQDTNGLQFMWLLQITNGNPNFTVVGDDDQVLYSWRGARIENMLEFKDNFVDTKVVRLEQNFRSTGHILDVANAIIEKNEKRLGKRLYTKDEQGNKVNVMSFLNADDEANWVVQQIKDSLAGGMKPNDIAILSRASHVLNIIEQRMTFAGIPYVLSGGRRFQDKAEIRDAMAYLRLAANPEDSSAFERVVNIPKRGMGDMAVKKIVDASEKARDARANLSLMDITRNHTVGKTLHGDVPERLSEFVTAIREANRIFWRGGNASQVLEFILEESGYMTDLRQQEREAKEAGEASLQETLQTRIDNINDLFTIGKDKQPLELVEHLGLTEDGRAKKSDAVWIGTIHAAKGLEWPLVIGLAWEENVLPSWQALNESQENIDEERRCAYVEVTRARTTLYLTTTGERFQKPASPSRFLDDIPDAHSNKYDIG